MTAPSHYGPAASPLPPFARGAVPPTADMTLTDTERRSVGLEQPLELPEVPWRMPDGSPSMIGEPTLAGPNNTPPAVPARWSTKTARETYDQHIDYSVGRAGVTEIFHGAIQATRSGAPGDSQKHVYLYGIVEIREAVSHATGPDSSSFVVVKLGGGQAGQGGPAQFAQVVGMIGNEPTVVGRDPLVPGSQPRRQFGVSARRDSRGHTTFQVDRMRGDVGVVVHRPNPNASPQLRAQAWEGWQLPPDVALALLPQREHNSVHPQQVVAAAAGRAAVSDAALAAIWVPQEAERD